MSNFGDKNILIKLRSQEEEVRFDCNDMTPLQDSLTVTYLHTYIINFSLLQLTLIKLPESPILKNVGPTINMRTYITF